MSHWTLEICVVRSLWNLCRFRKFGWDRENLVVLCLEHVKRTQTNSKKYCSAINRSQFISHWTLEFFVVRSLWNLCRFREFGWDRENLVVLCSAHERRTQKNCKGDWSAIYRSQFIIHWILECFVVRSLWNLCRFREFGWDRENLVVLCKEHVKRTQQNSKKISQQFIVHNL